MGMYGWRDCFPVRQARVRPLACFSVMFLLGLILGARLQPSIALCLAACVAALTGAALCRLNRKSALAFIMLLGTCLGMARMVQTQTAFTPVDTRYSVAMVGRVASEPYNNPDTGRLICRFELETAYGRPYTLPLRLYLRGEEDALASIAYGQRLSLTGHIWANDAPTNPHEFDYAQWLRRNGFRAIATAKIEDVVLLETKADLGSLLVNARQAVGRRIDRLFPVNAPMVRALVLGDRSLLGEEMRERLNATGTAHLISISGLHVTVLAFALSWLLGRFMPPRRANLMTLAPLLAYGALIGFTAPFMRALMMFAVMSFAPIVGLPSDPVTRLAAAMLVWLAIRPLDVSDGGFQLSYGASAGILLLMPPILRLLRVDRLLGQRRKASASRRLLRQTVAYLPTLLCASLAAQLATLPAVVACFGVQSLVSIPFNLVCVPLCMAGYVLSLVALAASIVSLPVGILVARVPDVLFHMLLSVTAMSARLPVSTVRIARYPALLVLIHAVIVLAASDLSRLVRRMRRMLPLALIPLAALSSLLAWTAAWPFRVTFLDAGQADCAVLTTRGHTYVFDTGDTYTPAADYLGAACVHLDGVFLSHPHRDHAGGLTDILNTLCPEAIYVPVGWFDVEETSPAVEEGITKAREMGVPVIELGTGDALRLSEDAELTVWCPDRSTVPESVNDMSLLLRVESGGRSVLFTGDLTISGEPDDAPECDILKVAHHGADNATSTDFLLSALPEYAVISVGENSFGHPGDFALERIESSGAEIMRTDQLGAITFTLRDGVFLIDTYLEAQDDVE